jgi:hypothetical protein
MDQEIRQIMMNTLPELTTHIRDVLCAQMLYGGGIISHNTSTNDTSQVIRTPPCLFNNHPEILTFSSGFLLSAPKLPFHNLFRPGPLFFIVLHGEKEIPGPLKKPHDKDINTTTPNNINHQLLWPILYRTPSNNLSRKPDGPLCFHCKEMPYPSRQNTHV